MGLDDLVEVGGHDDEVASVDEPCGDELGRERVDGVGAGGELELDVVQLLRRVPQSQHQVDHAQPRST